MNQRLSVSKQFSFFLLTFSFQFQLFCIVLLVELYEPTIVCIEAIQLLSPYVLFPILVLFPSPLSFHLFFLLKSKTFLSSARTSGLNLSKVFWAIFDNFELLFREGEFID